MATHEADSGPSAKRSLGNAGTGLSPAGASFISAHCSPFSPPHEIITGPPKVPDPRTHDSTCTAYIWQNFDLPVTAAGQVIIMNPDPLAPLPVAWGADDLDFTSQRDAKFWAQTYESTGLSDMMCQIKSLAENSAQHRIVGCGMKVWVSKDTAQTSRGHIEAGQFRISRAQYKGKNGFKRQGGSGVTPQADGVDPYYQARTEDWSKTGAFGTAYNNPTPNRLIASIERAKTQDMGFLPADEGCTLRWTDSNDFEFNDTIYRSMIAPSKSSYTNGYLPFAATHNNNVGNWVKGNPVYKGFAGRVMHDRDTGAATGTTGSSVIAPGVVAGTALTPAPPDEGFLGEESASDPYTREASGMQQTFYFMPTYYDNVDGSIPSAFPNMKAIGTGKLGYFECNVGDVSLYPGDRRGIYYVNCSADASQFPDAYYAEEFNTWADDKANFGNGLYAYVNGVDSLQRLTVQVVWHVEYKPTFQALDRGTPSPVDMSYEELKVLAGDPVSFPIVVKGHSFFKSLLRGLKQATTGAARVLGVASNIAKIVPIPQVQTAGTVMGMGSTFAGGLSTVF